MNEDSGISRPITARKLLAVEGKTDKAFFESLLGSMALTDIQVEKYDSATNFKNWIKYMPKISGFRKLNSIAVIRDADSNPKGSFESIVGSLRRNGFDEPKRHASFTEGSPRIGVFIVPNIQMHGNLETLCLDSIIQDPAMECVEMYVKCLQAKKIKLGDLSKVKCLSFLISRSNPEIRLGEAAGSDIPLDSEAFQEIRDFLLAF
jgi:hypothetical protein